ncbi:hypothetical protein F5878DRAFT_520064, partial [Lentinula raphanica]
FVLIDSDIVSPLGLKRRTLPTPHRMSLAMSDGKPSVYTATEYCKVSLRDPSGYWKSKQVRALILPSLCYPMILGLPFLSHNSLVIDYATRSVKPRDVEFDLLNPCPVEAATPSVPLESPKIRRDKANRKLQQELSSVLDNMKSLRHEFKEFVDRNPHRFTSEPVSPFNVVAAVKARLEQLEELAKYEQFSDDIKAEYSDVFGDIPHLDELPTDVTCRID